MGYVPAPFYQVVDHLGMVIRYCVGMATCPEGCHGLVVSGNGVIENDVWGHNIAIRGASWTDKEMGNERVVR